MQNNLKRIHFNLEPVRYNLPMEKEQILIQKSTAGDLQAFDELIKPYENRLYNFLAKMCNNHETAQDMVQETFLNVFKNIKNYRAEAKFSTWLFQIATNNCLMLKRKNEHKVTHSLDEHPEHPFEIIDLQKTPEEKYTQEELQAIVEEALQKLEPLYRSVFILSEVDGFSGPEIANILKITLPNVKARIRRAKEKLKKLLGPKLLKRCCDCQNMPGEAHKQIMECIKKARY